MIAKKSSRSSNIYGLRATFRFENSVMGRRHSLPTIGKKLRRFGSSATDAGSKSEVQRRVDRTVCEAVR